MRHKKTASALALLAALTVSAAAATASAADTRVYPRDSFVFGRGYSEWSAAWQQWTSSIPVATHPLFGNGDCSVGQSGPVWFLGGAYNTTTVSRNCTVPYGKALYFPILNSGCLDIEAVNGSCNPDTLANPYIPNARKAVADGMDTVTDLQVTLDGLPIRLDFKKDFRVQANAFSTFVPEDNIFKVADGNPNITGGQSLWGVDDGYYVMLKPLAPYPNPHILRFVGKNGSFVLDVTYKITVKKP